MFHLRNGHTGSCYCRNWKVTPDPGPVFPQFVTPGPKEKRRILPDSTPVIRIRFHLWNRVRVPRRGVRNLIFLSPGQILFCKFWIQIRHQLPFKQSDSCLSPGKYMSIKQTATFFSVNTKSNPDPATGKKTTLLVLLEATEVQYQKSKIQSMRTSGTL